MAEVELALDQALRAVVGIAARTDWPAVDGHQAAADHREPVVAGHAGICQRLRKSSPCSGCMLITKRSGASGGVALRQAAIRSVRSSTSNTSANRPTASALTPAARRTGRTRRQLPRGQYQPARRARLGARLRRSACTASQPARQTPAPPAAKPPTAISTERRSAAGASNSPAKPATPASSTASEAGFEAAHIAADHPQRRHPRQLQHRRQAEMPPAVSARRPGRTAAGHRLAAGRRPRPGRPAGRRRHGARQSRYATPSSAGGQPDHARTPAHRLPAIVRWLWPSTRSMAQSSRWRWREAARGQWPPPPQLSSAASSATRFRNASARSSVWRISGRPDLERLDTHAAHIVPRSTSAVAHRDELAPPGWRRRAPPPPSGR
jgi:hypothetical protein